MLAVGCYHQKRGIGVFRHKFLNPEHQSNSDTQPPMCKVVSAVTLQVAFKRFTKSKKM